MTGAVDGNGMPVWTPGCTIATRYPVEAATVERKDGCAIYRPMRWVWAFWAQPSACPPTVRPDFCGMALGDPFPHIRRMSGGRRLYWLPAEQANWGPLLDAIREEGPELDEWDRAALGAAGQRLDGEADAALQAARRSPWSGRTGCCSDDLPAKRWLKCEPVLLGSNSSSGEGLPTRQP